MEGEPLYPRGPGYGVDSRVMCGLRLAALNPNPDPNPNPNPNPNP